MKDCNEIVNCIGRREFLVRSAFVAGGLVLTIAGAGTALGSVGDGVDVVVAIDDKSPLSKIDGSLVVDSAKGKIIIVRTSEAAFAAFSAVCTHKRGIVEYDAAKKRFECPKHHSKFDSTTGNVLDGPADDPLLSYPAKGTPASVTVSVGA